MRQLKTIVRLLVQSIHVVHETPVQGLIQETAVDTVTDYESVRYYSLNELPLIWPSYTGWPGTPIFKLRISERKIDFLARHFELQKLKFSRKLDK